MAVRLRGSVWYIEFQHNGRRTRKSANEILSKQSASREEALAAELRLRAELRGEPWRGVTFEQAEAKLKWADGFASDQRRASHWHAVAEFLSQIPVDRVVDAAEAYAEDATKQGLAPATINRRLSLMRQFAKRAYERGVIKAPNYKSVRLLDEDNVRAVYLKDAQVHALARAAEDPETERAILLAAYTGLPAQELLELTQRDVTAEGDIRIKRNDRISIIPVPSKYKELLVPLPIGLTPDQLRRKFERARERAGLPDVQFRDLRQTYIRWLIQAGLAPDLVRELAGLESPDSLKRHNELIARIERLGQH